MVLKGRRHTATFAVLATATAAFAMLQSLIIPVLTRIQAELETDQSTVTWVLTAYLLSAAVCTPLLGRLGDAVGKKRMFVVTVGALAVGSLVAALAPSAGWMIAARVIQGAGGATLPLAFGIIRDEFDEESRNQAISVVAALATAGFGAGIVAGGPIVDGLGYHWLFWLPMIITGLTAVAAAFVIPESPVRAEGRLPIAPAMLLSAWLVALLLAVSKGNDWGWTSATVLGLLVAAAAVAALWARTELRVQVPLIDMVMMRRRGVWTANLVTGVIGFGMYSALGFLPQFLQTPTESGYGFGVSITQSGQIILPSSVLAFMTGLASARLIRRFGPRVVVATACLLNAVAFGSIALFHDEIWQIVLAIAVQGIGNGMVTSSMAQIIMASVPPEQSGVASGMNFNVRTIGGAVGTAVMAGVVTASHSAGGFPAEHGYTVGFAVLAVSLVGAAFAAWLIPDFRRTPTRVLVSSAG